MITEEEKIKQVISLDAMNKAIAVFMGAKIDKDGRIHGLSRKGHYRASSLNYHSSWVALLPVLYKIISLGSYSYELGSMNNTDYHFVAIADVKHQNKKQLVFIPSRDSLITIAHQAVYKFIAEHF
mgnify:CR=1 FL=1